MSTEKQNEQPSQEAIDFLFAEIMHGRITKEIQTNHEVQMLVTTLLEQQEGLEDKITGLEAKVDELEFEIDDARDDKRTAENRANDAEEELQDFENTNARIPEKTLADQLKNKIILRFSKQLTLEDVEWLEKHIQNKKGVPAYNPHI